MTVASLQKKKKYFSKIDLVCAFYHISISPDHVQKTALVSPAALFEYIKMPFGLRNAPVS